MCLCYLFFLVINCNLLYSPLRWTQCNSGRRTWDGPGEVEGAIQFCPINIVAPGESLLYIQCILYCSVRNSVEAAHVIALAIEHYCSNHVQRFGSSVNCRYERIFGRLCTLCWGRSRAGAEHAGLTIASRRRSHCICDLSEGEVCHGGSRTRSRGQQETCAARDSSFSSIGSDRVALDIYKPSNSPTPTTPNAGEEGES